MRAEELKKKHDPNKLGEFSNENYLELYFYARGLELSRKEYSKAQLMEFANQIEDYEHESGHSIWEDEREPEEFVNQFLKEK